jgi:polar amino acid transport system ATP-binding protein
MSVVTMTNVTKRFGARTVLDGVSMSLDEHEVVCLIGASGSGKSTLLRCLNLLESIDGGDITVHGVSVLDPRVDPDRVRRQVGLVFQSFNLFPHLSVRDNVALGPRYAVGVSRDEARQRADELLDRIGLGSRADEFPDRLSGGQQQRVAIVRSLAMNPSVLLLDEVTSALDPGLVGEVLDLLSDLAARGTTMLIATHEMAFAKEVAHRVAYLHEGRIAEIGPAADVFSRPRDERTRRFLERATRDNCRKEFLVAVPRQVIHDLVHGKPHQLVDFVVRLELAGEDGHQVVHDNFLTTLAVGVVGRAHKILNSAVEVGLFQHFTKCGLFQRLTAV